MINVNQQALLELIKASQFGTAPLFPEGVSWTAVLKEAWAQTVVAIASPAVPKEEKEQWRIPEAQNKMRFLQNLNEQTALIKLFHHAGISMVILKGFASAMYYPVPVQRSMGDIDFIVPQERMEEAAKLMEENGYVILHQTDRHYTYKKNHMIYELHRRYCEDNWDFEHLITAGIPKAVSREVYGKAFPVFPDEVNGLVLLDHIRGHLYSGLGLRQIIDWMMFVHAHPDDAIWEDRLLPPVRESGLETLAKTLTKMCKLWFGLPDKLSWCDSADEDTARRLMELVFSFGNFGRKTRSDMTPMDVIVTEVSRYGVFRYLQKAGESTWKAYQKHHFLRPFAGVYQGFRFAKKGTLALLHGEKNKVESSFAKKNYDFYKELEINYYQKNRSEKPQE